jgi:hypothetical protein
MFVSSELDNTPIADGHGWAVYRPENFINRTGTDTKGKKISVPIDTQSWYSIDPLTCLEIFKTSYLVQSAISRHAQIVSSLNFKVIPSYTIEDEIVYDIKRSKSILDLIGDIEITPNDFKYNLQGKIREVKEQQKHRLNIKKYLGKYFIKNDLSNFDSCLRQYVKDIKRLVNESSSQIEDWIYKPSDKIQFQDFLLQYVIDLLLHGRVAIQLPTIFTDERNISILDKDLEPFDGFALLPGGSVYQIAHKYIGEDIMLGEDSPAYIQLMYSLMGFGFLDPKIFSAKELSTAQYLPNSSMQEGFKPLDAVLLSILEVNNFSSMMVDYANAEKPPEYLIFVIDDTSMFGQGSSIADKDKVDLEEIERLETSINKRRKEEQVRILKQVGKDVKLINVSKENIIPMLMQREERIEKIVNRIFNGTSNELSMQDTSAIINNSTGEVQNNIYYNSVIKPIVETIENQFTYEILQRRFGYASNFNDRIARWQLKFQDSESEVSQIQKAQIAMSTNLYSKNEVRTLILGLDPTNNPEDDKLTSTTMPIGESNVQV